MAELLTTGLDLLVQLPRMRFADIEFPYTKYVVKGSLRQATHEYPKAHGGAPEKLGRKLYTISVDAVFDKALLPPWNQNGTDLWPGSLSDLFERFDEGLTSDLVIPSVGTIKALCTNWSRELVTKTRRSGETVSLEFLEDQSQAFLVNGLVNVRANDFTNKSVMIASALDSARPNLTPKEASLFDQLLGALDTVAAIVTYGAMVSSILLNAVSNAENLFNTLDLSSIYLNQAGAYVLLAAFMDGWAATLALLEDLKRQSVPILPYVCFATMSVVDVANDVYGDSSRAVEIMQLNNLPDPLRIAQGTMLRVYAPTDAAA